MVGPSRRPTPRPEPEPAVEALAGAGLLPGLFPLSLEALRTTFAEIRSGNPERAARTFTSSGYPTAVLDQLALQALRPLLKSFSVSSDSPVLRSWGSLPLSAGALDKGLSLLLRSGQIFVAQEIIKSRQMTERDWTQCPGALTQVDELIRRDLQKDPRSALEWFGMTSLPAATFQTPGFVQLAVPAVCTLLSHYSNFFNKPPNERFAPIMRILGPMLLGESYHQQRAQIRETLAPVAVALRAASGEPERNGSAEVARNQLHQLFGHY